MLPIGETKRQKFEFIHDKTCRTMSLDFHMYLLAPIIFLVLYYRPKFGVFWNLFLVLVAIFIALAPRIIWNIPHVFEYTKIDSFWTIGGLMQVYFFRTDSRAMGYVLGMFCGYLIRKKPNLYCGGSIGELFLWITCSALTFWSMDWTNYIMGSVVSLD